MKLIFRDLRANLELAVEYVIELASNPRNTLDSDYTSDSEDAPVVLCNVKLTSAVRKQLALSIRDLMQHGLMPVSILINVLMNSFTLSCAFRPEEVWIRTLILVLLSLYFQSKNLYQLFYEIHFQISSSRS
jgi:hypothetical protein